MKLLKPGIILLIICLLAAMSLAATNEITQGPIRKQRQEAQDLARKQVMPDAKSFEDLDISSFEISGIKGASIAKDDSGNSIGLVVVAMPNGYAGAIEVIVGLLSNGEVSGLRIGSHSETPGLGAKAKEAEFYSQFDNKNALTGINVVKNSPSDNDIIAISGATVTSNAVNSGVSSASELLQKLVEEGVLNEN